jgi:3-phosphoshikimate 1-carboxyvinyltransferase/cytidylate kinase
MGAVAGCPISAVFDGDASLRSRPMRRILDPLEKMGAKVTSAAEGGLLPLTVQGARDPLPITYKTPVASAQIKSAVLLAGLSAPGTTTVIESEASRDHTELMLKHFGADITSVAEGAHGRRITLVGQPELHGATVIVPADPSSAAFPIVAALIVEGSDVVLSDVMTNPLRTGLFTTLREMGASIEESEVRGDAGEPMARLRVRASKLRGVEVPPERAPSMIDEYLVLAVAASFAEGTTIMRGLQELRVKESDRLEATADMLRVNGVKVTVSGDDLIVEGRGHVPGGGTVAPHRDVRAGDGLRLRSAGHSRRHRLHRHQFPGLHSDDAVAGGRVFMIIAIDGPAASGKGTLGKRLAHHYGYRHLDTGVIYRAVAYALMQSGHDLRDEAAAVQAALELDPEKFGNPALKTQTAGEGASIVSAIPRVREVLLNFQRQFAAGPPGAVLDGRDIGTVICPDADVKIFVVADPKVRARRRTMEARARGEAADEAAVLADIIQRDERDKNRPIAPLKPAADAYLLDNSQLDIDGGDRAAIDIIEAVRAGRSRG